MQIKPTNNCHKPNQNKQVNKHKTKTESCYLHFVCFPPRARLFTAAFPSVRSGDTALVKAEVLDEGIEPKQIVKTFKLVIVNDSNDSEMSLPCSLSILERYMSWG